MTEAQADTILRALYEIERDFAFICGCTMTDRPDLPLSEVGWKIDFAPRLACIEQARASVLAALQSNTAGYVGESSTRANLFAIDAAVEKMERQAHECCGGRPRDFRRSIAPCAVTMK